MPCPAPSAVLTGLVLSGLPSDRFLFAGFLPAKAGERRSGAGRIESRARHVDLFRIGPAPGRKLWRQMAEILGTRTAAVAREMTKLHEEVRRGTLAELAAHYAQGRARPRAK